MVAFHFLYGYLLYGYFLYGFVWLLFGCQGTSHWHSLYLKLVSHKRSFLVPHQYSLSNVSLCYMIVDLEEQGLS